MVAQPPLLVEFYGSSDRKPVREWLLTLDRDQRREIGADIQAIQWRWPVSKPLVDGLGAGLHEVRSTFCGRAFRIFFCIIGRRMILLHGIEKKRRNTPKAALELARKRMREVQHGTKR